MAGKTYSAGTIFLQVVPVFRDTMDQIRREANDLNKALKKDLDESVEQGGRDGGKKAGQAIADEIEKGTKDVGKKAAEKYMGDFDAALRRGMARTQRELKPLKQAIKVEDAEVRQRFEQIERDHTELAKRLKGKRLGVDVDADKAYRDLARLNMQMQLLQETAKNLRTKNDLKAAFSGIDGFVRKVKQAAPALKDAFGVQQYEQEWSHFDRTVQKHLKNVVKNVSGSVVPELRKVKAEAEELMTLRVNVDIDEAGLEERIAMIRGRLAAAGAEAARPGEFQSKATVQNVGQSLIELELLDKAMDKIDGRTLRVRTDMNLRDRINEMGLFSALLSQITHKHRGLSSDQRDNANAFRAFNALILSAVTLLPALIPLIAGLGAAFIALGPAMAGVVAGLGVMVLGFSGIGDAVKAMADVEKNAAQETEAASRQIRDAQYAIADAERALTRAREDAAERASDAARAVARAQEDAARAVEDALQRQEDAEKSLADAQRDATEAQQALREARRLAQQDLDDVADRSRQNALDERQAVIDLFNAQVDYTTTRQDGAATNLEKEQASINLEQARLRLEEIREEEKELAKERRKGQTQGVDGTERVQTAQDAVTAAIQAEQEARENLAEAAAAVDQARVDGAERVSDAIRAQRRAAEDSAEAISDAQRNLIRSQQRYQDALKDTAEVGSTSMQNLEDAMSKLSPAGRRFARYLYSLRREFWLLRAAAQQGLLPGVQDMMETLLDKYGPSFRRFVGNMAKAMGDLFRLTGDTLTSPAWQRFFKMMSKNAPMFLRIFGRTTLNWMGVFAEIFRIIAPYTEKFMRALEGVSRSALKFTRSKEGAKFWRDFMEFAAKIGPKVWEFFKNLWKAAMNLGEALAPLGGMILKVVDKILEWIGNMNPKTLGAIVTGILAMFIAFQAMNGVIAAVMAGSTLVLTILAGGPLAVALIVVGALILIGGALIALYNTSDTARKVMNAAFEAIGDVFQWVWEEVIRPVLRGFAWWWRKLSENVQEIWDEVLGPVFNELGDVFSWLWEEILRPFFRWLGRRWEEISNAIAWVYENILWPVFDMLGTLIWKTLWHGIIKPAFKLIAGAFEAMGKTLKWVWRNVIAPVLDALGLNVSEDLVEAFGQGVDAIVNLWNGLRDALAEPVRFFIEEVLNGGLIRGFNWVARKIGSDTIPNIPTPKWTENGGHKRGNSDAGYQHASTGGGRFATGGVLPGYTPGRDVHHFASPTAGSLHLSGGEAIMRPEVTMAMGSGWVNAMNKAARLGGIDAVRKMAMGQGYARGGVFWPVPGRTTSTYRGHDGVDINRGSGWADYGDPIVSYTGGRVTYVGTGRGYGQAIFIDGVNGPEVVYGHTSAALVRAGQFVRGGQLIGRVGNTGNSDYPHLHFGIPGGTYDQALALLSGAYIGDAAASPSSGGGMPKWLEAIIGTPMKWVKGLVEKGMDKLGQVVDGPYLDMLTKLPLRLADGLVGKITEIFGGNTANGSGSAEIRNAVRDVASSYGWGGGDMWEALSEIVARESSWDPNAANPSSSARGLFQKMTSIHGPLEDTVEGQARWGLEYIKSRYGNPMNALMHHDSNGWYANGGILGEGGGSHGVSDNGTMMYDSGGYLPPGLTTVLNLTGKPEPVFTADQFERMGRGTGSGITYAPTFNQSDLTPQDVTDDLMFAMRTLEKRGRYAGSEA